MGGPAFGSDQLSLTASRSDHPALDHRAMDSGKSSDVRQYSYSGVTCHREVGTMPCHFDAITSVDRGREPGTVLHVLENKIPVMAPSRPITSSAGPVRR